MIRDEIIKELFNKQDIKYRDFQAKLIPSKTADDMIGVRTPELRKYAKELLKREDSGEFLEILGVLFYFHLSPLELDNFLLHLINIPFDLHLAL